MAMLEGESLNFWVVFKRAIQIRDMKRRDESLIFKLAYFKRAIKEQLLVILKGLAYS